MLPTFRVVIDQPELLCPLVRRFLLLDNNKLNFSFFIDACLLGCQDTASDGFFEGGGYHHLRCFRASFQKALLQLRNLLEPCAERLVAYAEYPCNFLIGVPDFSQPLDNLEHGRSLPVINILGGCVDLDLFGYFVQLSCHVLPHVRTEHAGRGRGEHVNLRGVVDSDQRARS